ncbi:ABC transporter permease [Nonomuraea candida]|uniref:ABC transporter permease n=1 Tax=Nonomuraea candida TaxID=359159 RepID=UPI0005BAE855|nr:ABC transporter permease [Nonomuraea candida]
MIDTGALRAEWTKFSSIRATMVLSLAAVVVSALSGWLFGNAAAGEYAAATAQERLDFDPLMEVMRGVFISQLLVSALGVLVASSEYGSGTLHASLAAVGRRGRLMAAKAGITALTALPVSVASVWLMFAIGQSTLAAGGAPSVPPGGPHALAMLLLGPVVLTLLALFGLALGFLLRGTAAAVNVSTAFLLLPTLASSSPGFLRDLMENFWPSTAAFQALYGTSWLPPAAAFGLFVAFVAALLVAAFARFERRDA